MTNEGQLPMMKNMLNSAMKAGLDMSLFHCYILGSQKEAAIYSSKEFKSLTTQKLEVILENMKLDKEVLWIDNDIYIFSNFLSHIRSFGGKFVMQDDLWGACTGFFLARSDVFSLKAIQASIQYLKTNQATSVNDQHAFNYVYKRTIGVNITLLPQEEYPNGEIYFNRNVTSKARIVHCNYLMGTSEKEQRLKDHNLWDDSDTAFNIVKKYSHLQNEFTPTTA
jgi:hypothetical protein